MIFATNNLDKLKQLKDLAPMLNIVGLREYGIEIDIEEDGKTLEENAIKKALTIYNQTKQSVVADDSGLFIDYFESVIIFFCFSIMKIVYKLCYLIQ